MSKQRKRDRVDISSFIDTETLREDVEESSLEELRHEALKNRETTGSVTENRAARSRRVSILQQMGYDIRHIDELEPHPDNFFSLDPEEIDNLAATIRETGRTAPIIYRTRQNGQKDQIIGGERRWHAARRNVEITGDESWAMVPVQNLGPLNDLEAMFHLVSDNLTNRKLSPSELARSVDIAGERIALRRKQEPEFEKESQGKKTRDLVAEMFSISGPTVTRLQNINRNLSDEGKRLLDKKKITRQQALEIAKLDEEEQEEITGRIAREDLDSETVGEYVNNASAKSRKAKTVNDFLENAQKSLQKATKVKGSPDRIMLAQMRVYLMELEEKLDQAEA